MLVFLDTTGAMVATAPKSVGRNSAAMSTIYIVAPISGAMMSLSFRLPNGDEVNPDLADAVHNAVEILKGVNLPAGVHVWSYAIPASVTRVAGTVMYTVTTTFEGGGISTGSGTFVVSPATTKTLPSSAPGVDVWHEILAELARIYAEMETVIGNSPVTGLDGYASTVTALISKIAALIGNEPIESPLGGATTISALLGWLKYESVRFSAVIGDGSISFAGSLIEAVNTLREISVGKTSDPSRVYATASDGSPALLPYAETPTAYSVPQRDGAGRVKTASPASDADAVDFGSFSAEKERVGKLITDLQTAVNRLSRAFAFDNWEAALVELTKPALAEAREKYKIGDAILIRDVEAPDGWVSGYAVSPFPYPGGNNIQNPFDGTDAFTVGWLIISPLEAPKVSLDGYATTEEAKAFADAAESEAKSYAAEEVAGVSDRVDILDKKVENLRAALSPEYFTTDAAVAYVKEVPADALPFAEAKEVGGMSYADGGAIKNAAVTALEIEGANLIDLRQYSGDTVFRLDIGKHLPAGVTYQISAVGTTEHPTDTKMLVAYSDSAQDKTKSINYFTAGQRTYLTFIPEFDFNQILFYAAASYANSLNIKFTVTDAMLTRGANNIPFAPYAKRSYPIPAEVQALDGWGEGISADCHNRVDFEKKQYRQEVRRIRLDGSEEWRKSVQEGIFQASTRLSELAGNTTVLRPVISNGYGFFDWYHPDASVKPYFRIAPSSDALWIEATVDRFAGVDAWKAYLAANPVEIVYPIATPIVTDLPNLSDDNFIAVEGGGTVTAVNEHELAAPTKIEYQLKEATA